MHFVRKQDVDKPLHETPLSFDINYSYDAHPSSTVWSFEFKVDFNLDESLEGMVLASHQVTHAATSGLGSAAGHGLSFRDDDQLISHADVVIHDGSCQGSGPASPGGAATQGAKEEHLHVRQRSLHGRSAPLSGRHHSSVPLTRLLLVTVSDDGLWVGHTNSEFTPARRQCPWRRLR